MPVGKDEEHLLDDPQPHQSYPPLRERLLCAALTGILASKSYAINYPETLDTVSYLADQIAEKTFRHYTRMMKSPDRK